ncbi:hypothetical protein GQ54DRAFT_300840, partial [Martensiomyces pterosporus]
MHMQMVLGGVTVQGVDDDVAVVPLDEDIPYTAQGLVQPALLERGRALCVHDESCQLQKAVAPGVKCEPLADVGSDSVVPETPRKDL